MRDPAKHWGISSSQGGVNNAIHVPANIPTMVLLSSWSWSHSPSFALLLSGNMPPYQEDTGVITSHPFAHKKSELSSYETSTTQSCSIDSVSFWLQELCVLFLQEPQHVWSLRLAQQELPEELELEDYRVLFLSKLVCNLLWTCSFSPWFVCLFWLFFFNGKYINVPSKRLRK